jgi:hypothetical protein
LPDSDWTLHVMAFSLMPPSLVIGPAYPLQGPRIPEAAEANNTASLQCLHLPGQTTKYIIRLKIYNINQISSHSLRTNVIVAKCIHWNKNEIKNLSKP